MLTKDQFKRHIDDILPGNIVTLLTDIAAKRRGNNIGMSSVCKEILIKILQGDIAIWLDIYNALTDNTHRVPDKADRVFLLLTPFFELMVTYQIINHMVFLHANHYLKNPERTVTKDYLYQSVTLILRSQILLTLYKLAKSFEAYQDVMLTGTTREGVDAYDSFQVDEQTRKFLNIALIMWELPLSGREAKELGNLTSYFFSYLRFNENSGNVFSKSLLIAWPKLIENMSYENFAGMLIHIVANDLPEYPELDKEIYRITLPHVKHYYNFLLDKFRSWSSPARRFASYLSPVLTASGALFTGSLFAAAYYYSDAQSGERLPRQHSLQIPMLISSAISTATTLVGSYCWYKGVSRRREQKQVIEQEKSEIFNKLLEKFPPEYLTSYTEKFIESLAIKTTQKNLLKLIVTNLQPTELTMPGWRGLGEHSQQYLDKLSQVLLMVHFFRFFPMDEELDFSRVMIVQLRNDQQETLAGVTLEDRAIAIESLPTPASTAPGRPLRSKGSAATLSLSTSMSPIPRPAAAASQSLPATYQHDGIEYYLVEDKASRRKAYFEKLANKVKQPHDVDKLQQMYNSFVTPRGHSGYKMSGSILVFKLISQKFRFAFKHVGQLNVNSESVACYQFWFSYTK
jgi:hypothetical protein